MVHDFGLNLPKLVDIQAIKNANILEEGTFGLRDKQSEEIVITAYDYKAVLELARKIIKGNEQEKVWPRSATHYNGEKPEYWQLHKFLEDYELVFHTFTPIVWQCKHRLEFVNSLYHDYYACKYDDVLRQSIVSSDAHNIGHLFNEFLKFKKLRNRIALRKFPVMCSLVTKDSVDHTSTGELVEYLFNQFEENEFTLDVKSEGGYRGGTRFLLGLKDQLILNYIGLTVFENWKVDCKIDFNPLIEYMDNVEKYIETKFLK